MERTKKGGYFPVNMGAPLFQKAVLLKACFTAVNS